MLRIWVCWVTSRPNSGQRSSDGEFAGGHEIVGLEHVEAGSFTGVQAGQLYAIGDRARPRRWCGVAPDSSTINSAPLPAGMHCAARSTTRAAVKRTGSPLWIASTSAVRHLGQLCDGRERVSSPVRCLSICHRASQTRDRSPSPSPGRPLARVARLVRFVSGSAVRRSASRRIGAPTRRKRRPRSARMPMTVAAAALTIPATGGSAGSRLWLSPTGVRRGLRGPELRDAMCPSRGGGHAG